MLNTASCFIFVALNTEFKRKEDITETKNKQKWSFKGD